MVVVVVVEAAVVAVAVPKAVAFRFNRPVSSVGRARDS